LKLSTQEPLLAQVTDPADPRLVELSELLQATFADPDVVLGLDRMQEFLAANEAGAGRRFCVLVAEQDGAVTGGSVFSHVARSNCGFSEYIVVHRAMRGRGLGRRLFDARKAVLDAEARNHGRSQCRGLFIEVDNPRRTPPQFAAAERHTAMDTLDRLQVFDHLGFRRVGVPYTQPPLADGKGAIDYLDLLFVPWDEAVPQRAQIPADWVFDTLEVIWSAWAPRTYSRYLDDLKAHVSTRDVSLSSAVPSN
jgi:GNAT superfamily N-acetyltransferase